MSRPAEAVEQARIDVVPKIVLGGHAANGAEGGPFGGSSVLEGLLALLLADRAGIDAMSTATTAPSPEAQAIRDQLRERIGKDRGEST